MAKKKIKRIAVLTSGGDSPGMNAAIRSVVRCAIYKGLAVYGVTRGYEGLIDDDMMPLNARSVSNILAKGGTILKTARSKRFLDKSKRKRAALNLRKRGIEGLVVIGGNGSFRGADIFTRESGIKTIGIAGTIDNDICGSDFTVGANTAVGTALDAIDKIRDTVTSMERIYVVEVMGRHEPFIATRVALAGGAEEVIFPGNKFSVTKMCNEIRSGRDRGKVSWIVIVSEGSATADDVSKKIEENTGYEVRPVILGHVQRGGSPSAFDRVLASALGAESVEAMLREKKSGMVGIVSGEYNFVNFKTACKKDMKKKRLDKNIYKLTKILAI